MNRKKKNRKVKKEMKYTGGKNMLKIFGLLNSRLSINFKSES